MLEKVESFLKYKVDFEKEFKVYCKDKTVPLEVRWECFIKYDLGDIRSFTPPCKVIRNIIHEDELYFEKYSTNYYVHIIDDIDDIKLKNNVKEYALKNFELGFIHDW